METQQVLTISGGLLTLILGVWKYSCSSNRDTREELSQMKSDAFNELNRLKDKISQNVNMLQCREHREALKNVADSHHIEIKAILTSIMSKLDKMAEIDKRLAIIENRRK